MSVLARSPDFILLDVRKEITNTNILFVQDDMQVYNIEILLIDNEQPVNLTDCTVTIRIKRADGITIEDSVDEIVGPSTLGKIRYVLKNEMYAVPGDVIGEISVYQEQRRLTAAQFKARARADIGDDDLISADDRLPILTKLISDTGSLKTGLEELAQNIGKSAYEIGVENGFVGTEQDWIDLVTLPKFNFVATYSITNLVDGVSSELKINPVAPSKALSHYSVFADDENISGILTISDGFTTVPLVFESDRITLNFYNDLQALTIATKLKELSNFNVLKYGILKIKEAE